MPVDLVMPQAGESVTSGVVVRWIKNPGEFVKRDEDVIEIETDKVTLSVPSPAAGVLTGVKVKAGDTVAIGQVLASIDDKAGAGAGAGAGQASAAPAAQVDAKPAPAVQAVAAEASAGSAVPVAAATDVRATPLAKKLAEENNVDLGNVTGTGAGGRIREQDVLAYMQSHTQPQGGSNGQAAKPAPAPSAGAAPRAGGAAQATSGRSVTRERMTPLRQRIAQRLVQAQHTAAMLTTFNECDMTAVMELRKQYKEEFEKKQGIGLGFMGFFVKAVCGALKAFPLVNASIVEDEQGNLAIEKHEYADVAIAVSTPKGLVVPVLRSAEKMSLAGVEMGIKELATKAKEGKLTLEDMQGGTFTITNGGVFGSLMSTPILNPPQSGILGMHAIKNRAIEHPVGSGQVAIRPMMYLALSYDHRLIDGAEAVQFLVKVKQAIEDPQRLLLEI
jgi:2-oxoglutarate dehydrogenase E2 component (dihydrolipoamide succinyltransferase)